MATLREQLQADLAAKRAETAALEQKIAALEGSASSWLDRDVEEIKGFFAAIKSHLPGLGS